jgi:GWxTD domain-containing protein
MKIKLINIFIIYLFIFISLASAQELDDSVNVYHKQGLINLKEGKIAEAEKLFNHSAKEYSYAPSYFELAKIEFDKNTVYSRQKARDYIQKAIWKEPRNIEYKMLKAQLMEFFSSSMAYDVYEEIINIDPNNTEALFNMGRICEKEFYEYYNSFMNYDDGSLSYNDYAYKYFSKAEKFFKKAIDYDPEKSDSYLHLTCLYSEAGEYNKGIPLLNKVIKKDSLNKNAWLFLGYLYYKTLNYEHCQDAYQKALDLMTEKERKEFKDSTTMMLSGDEEIEPGKIDKIVDDFWNSRDPLYLTKYNERLLEHFSRVAYSNIMFSVAKQNVEGWKSDRGEIMLRYGEPQSRIRLRPFINAGGKTQLMLKTDLWVYKNKTFGFTDDFFTNNFRFSVPNDNGRSLSQFNFDTYSYVNSLRRSDPEEYEPKFKGPVFTLPYTITQFKDLVDDKNRKTQVYLNYALNDEGSFVPGTSVKYQAGLFVFDSSNNKIAQQVKEIEYGQNESELAISSAKKYRINSLKVETIPDSVSMAFEIIRNKDGGVSTNHFKYKIKNFSDENLEMSDLVLAADVEKKTGAFTLTRGDIDLLPNPTGRFNNSTNIFLYYEVYNLRLDKDKKADFEQKISIKKVNAKSFIENVFSSLAGIFSKKNKDEITLTTNYQSFEKNAQVYLQLDMNNYKPGDYIITVTVNDELTGKETSSETLLKWR